MTVRMSGPVGQYQLQAAIAPGDRGGTLTGQNGGGLFRR